VVGLISILDRAIAPIVTFALRSYLVVSGHQLDGLVPIRLPMLESHRLVHADENPASVATGQACP
jgi:hypothetical protein